MGSLVRGMMGVGVGGGILAVDSQPPPLEKSSRYGTPKNTQF